MVTSAPGANAEGRAADTPAKSVAASPRIWRENDRRIVIALDGGPVVNVKADQPSVFEPLDRYLRERRR